jgi:hypothetical protein
MQASITPGHGFLRMMPDTSAGDMAGPDRFPAAGLNEYTILFVATCAGKALSPAGVVELVAGHLIADRGCMQDASLPGTDRDMGYVTVMQAQVTAGPADHSRCFARVIMNSPAG